MFNQDQANRCAERYGLTNPPEVHVLCRCNGCDGRLFFDGVNKGGTGTFLMCADCGCTYFLGMQASKIESRNLSQHGNQKDNQED